MKTQNKPKAPLFHRVAVKAFTVLLAFLLYWLLGFMVKDIDRLEGPKRTDYDQEFVDKKLAKEHTQLTQKIKRLKTKIEQQESNQKILRDSTQNLQRTIGQILAIQKDKTSAQNNDRSPAEKKAFSDSMNLFLTNQKKYQQINIGIAELTEQNQQLKAQEETLEKRLSKQRSKASEAYNKANHAHKMRIAIYKLGLLIPLLLVSLFFTYKYRLSPFFPLLLAGSIATVIKVSLVIHEHFPSELFKYALILVLIGVTIKLLLYFIQIVTTPKLDVLIKQYREAYERFQCPLCEYPIRRGPLKYLYWTRKTLKNLKVPPGDYEETEYNCPACGTELYENCTACNQVRHSLLPHCEHCNHEVEVLGS